MDRSSTKPKARKARLSPAEQQRAFAETARALGCDEDEAAFRDKLRVITRQKPKGDAPKVKPDE